MKHTVWSFSHYGNIQIPRILSFLVFDRYQTLSTIPDASHQI